MSDSMRSEVRRDIEHVLHPTTNLAQHRSHGALIIERGRGIYVYDINGKEYIEAMAGLWCAGLGFSEGALVDAAVTQMRRLPFYHGFGNKGVLPVIDLAEHLKRIVPFSASKVFFTNSGSEANDTQIKLIWHYNNATGRPRKKKIVARWGGYHGVTVATTCLTALPSYRDGFDLPIDRILHTDCPDAYRGMQPGESEEEFASRLADNLEKLIIAEGPDTVAAFIAEPVMAGGGVIPPPATYFSKIQSILKEYDVICIADEVVCGFGRTGKMFGSETVGMMPDTMTVAKQLSAAYLPIAAVIIPDWMYEVLVDESRRRGVFAHGITYGGHPVPAAVALRTLQLYEERDILSHVRRVSVRFQGRLRALLDHALVGDARGVGLLGGVELVANKETKKGFDPVRRVGATCAEFCIDEGLITRANGDVLLFCPPLIITDDEIDEMFDRLVRALDRTAMWLSS